MAIAASRITHLQDEATAHWHRDRGWRPHEADSGVLPARLVALHGANFDLWHLEDEARAPNASDGEIARTKRMIDRVNQARNDTVEALDALWSSETAAFMVAAAPLHSETPGMMADRLSILALKIFHTREECARDEAGAAHVARNRERLSVLVAQRADLAEAFDRLFADIAAGTRRFRLYRQMKMYNDPDLNPVIYRGSR